MPVSVTFQRDSAYDQLLDLILAGRLPTERPISERQISSELGIGRTPVREAMRALAQDGLLEIIPARGTFVRRISDDQLRELFEVRQALECQAAELAARRGASEQLRAFKSKLEKSRSAQNDGEIAETYEIGADFHVEVCRSAGNQILFELYMPIRIRFKATIRLGRYYDPKWIIDGIDQHLGILSAIESGDAQRARRQMSDHLRCSYESKKRILQELGLPDAPARFVEHQGAS
ncbi:MAG: GntR family transcriptional regulator [Hyphomicrobiaceae bacterium]